MAVTNEKACEKNHRKTDAIKKTGNLENFVILSIAFGYFLHICIEGGDFYQYQHKKASRRGSQKNAAVKGDRF